MKNYRSLDTKEIAAFIRQDLKAAFPTTKFSVRLSRYSMGSSVSVSWVDGPNAKQVEYITNNLNFSRFDGMQDMSWTADAWMYRGELVRGHASISLSRENSPAACVAAVEAARAANHVDADASLLSVKTSSYDGSGYIVSTEASQYDYWSAYGVAQRALAASTAYPAAPTGEEIDNDTQLTKEQAEREERDAPVRADIAEITEELTALGFTGIEATQTAEGVYAVRVPGLTLSSGRPMILTGSVAQVVSMAARRAPVKPAAPVPEMTAAELHEIEQAARVEFAGVLPAAVLERALEVTRQRIHVTDHGQGAVWLDAVDLPPVRVLN